MRRAAFGPLGVEVPVIGQGTWNLEHDDEQEAVTALETGIDAGMTHIDTAELYGSGRVERMISDVVTRRRDEIFLVSKVLPQNATYEGTLRACEGSLARLGTDRLDLYLLHWRGRVPLEETFRAFVDLTDSGKIGAFGVSNFDVDDLEDALAVAGPSRIACNQVLYHLEERSIEHSVLPWCRQHDVAIVAYSPFGSGRFPSPRSRGGKVLASVAARRGATPHRIALAFLVQRAAAFAIPKAGRTAHALDNAAAGNLVLTADEMDAIDAAFPMKPRRTLPTL